jgi:hypothetical protein
LGNKKNPIIIIIIAYFIFAGSPLMRSKIDDKTGNLHDDSSGRYSDNSSKIQHPCVSAVTGIISGTGIVEPVQHKTDNSANISNSIAQDDNERRRELALRQHAFFQLRLHLRRGANLVAMDRCGRFLYKNYQTRSRTAYF